MSRTSDSIVAELRRRIVSGELEVGDRLPPERDLCAQLGVSRPTLREAIRRLEASGVVKARRGPGGGHFVTRPSGRQIGEALADLLMLYGPSTVELEEFRLEFESETAAWAAERADADDRRELTELAAAAQREVERSRSRWPRLVELDSRFHLRLATASRNYVRKAIMEAIYEAINDFSLGLSRRADAAMRTATAADLAAIAAAVERGDGEAARAAMRVHIERYVELDPKARPGNGNRPA